MSSRALILESDWLVFIDGVQVPHQGISLRSSRDALTECRITLEPDQILANLRPQSVVSVWARERFPSQGGRDQLGLIASAQGQYYLYWEGLLAGHIHSKSPSARSFQLQCESMFSPWARTKAFMLGVGVFPKSQVISGSRVVPPGPTAADASAPFSFAVLANRFSQKKDSSFAARIQESVAFLSAGNAVLRQQTDRYSLLDRMSGLDDTVYRDLIAGVAFNLLNDGMAPLQDTSTVLEIVTFLQQFGFYSHYEVFAPVEGTKKGVSVLHEGPLGLDERYKFKQKYQLNQLMFLPELYFAPPPPCNFIFPDHIRSLSAGRDFYLEPTRALVRDPFRPTGGYKYYLAPTSILRGTASGEASGLTADLVFSQVSGALGAGDTGDTDSPYSAVSSQDGEEISLFKTILDIEIEKGINASVDSYRFESTQAYAANVAAQENKTDDQPNGYTQMMTAVANYRLRLDQYTRQVTVETTGHRDIVPGFSCAVFDEDISYVGLVESVAVSVDPLGTEVTTVGLTKARPISKPALDVIDTFAKAVQDLDGIRREKIAALVRSAYGQAAKRVRLGSGVPGIFGDGDEELAKQFDLKVAEIQSEYDTEIDGLLEKVSQNLDVPLSPGFLNRSLISAESTDSIYEDLLGCTRFYTSGYRFESPSFLPGTAALTGIASELSDALAPDEERDTQIAAMRFQAESMYALGQVFRIGRTAASISSKPSWQDVRDRKDSLGQSTFEWATRNFTKRKRYRLGDYCTNNGLDLRVETSDGPNSAPYLVMRPAASESGWDDTLLSKLVMPGSDTDPIIKELRKSVSGMLRTDVRQAIISEYSKRHFGARAFDGS